MIARENGEAINGDTLWYVVSVDGQQAFVHASMLVWEGLIPQDLPTPPATQTWNCSGNRYNCDSFYSRREMMSYWNACPGNPSKLDWDNDLIPCE